MFGWSEYTLLCELGPYYVNSELCELGTIFDKPQKFTRNLEEEYILYIHIYIYQKNAE